MNAALVINCTRLKNIRAGLKQTPIFIEESTALCITQHMLAVADSHCEILASATLLVGYEVV